MARIQNILVGVDLAHGDRLASPELGPEAQAAVVEALRLAGAWDGNVTFVSVLEVSPQTQSLIERDLENVQKTVEDVANDVLSKLVSHANSQGIAADHVVRFGTAWEELTKEASEGKYDLVMIGTRSSSRSSATLFGGTTCKMMRYSCCPVWVVKPTELRDIRDVAIATDLSPSCRATFDVAVTVTRAIQARLHVVHVLDSPDLKFLSVAGIGPDELTRIRGRLRESAEQKIREQLHQADFRTLPHGVKIEVLDGVPEVAIPDFVTANAIDLLVVGTHGQGGIKEFVWGSTAERLLPGLHASLLSVRPTESQNPN